MDPCEDESVREQEGTEKENLEKVSYSTESVLTWSKKGIKETLE